MQMFRSLVVVTLSAVVLSSIGSAEEPKKKPVKLTVDLFDSVADGKLQTEAPESGVIVSAKAWEKLAKVWGIKEPAKVDFEKEFLLVFTTGGSQLGVNTALDAKGNLTVEVFGSTDVRPGFRYVIKSVSREGVMTVSGKKLPKE
jgi:hypothetical protein